MSRKYNSEILYAISFAWQLGFLIVTPLGILLWLGIKLDKYFGFSPFFVSLGFALAIVFIVYEVYHWLVPLIKNKKKN